MKISIRRPDLWPSVGARVSVMDHCAEIRIDLAPLLDVSLEVYYRKNYWVKRGVCVFATLLGCVDIESDPGEGEKPIEDD